VYFAWRKVVGIVFVRFRAPLQYPVMNFIDAARGLSPSGLQYTVSIYPIDNSRRKKGDVTDYGPT
jgi:hypothetical protein